MSQTNPDRREDPPQATERRTRWPGWIWAIPIAALFIVGYLTLKQLTQQGPSVVVTFESAGGVKASDTKVQYQGLQVGQVDSVKLQKDLRHVDVSLQLDPDMAGHLGPGTRFWIAGGKPNLADLSSLKSVITGPFIGIDPHPGPKQDHYQGLPETPAVKETVAGTHFILKAATLGSVSRDSSIYYRDLDVGTVESTKLQADGRDFVIIAFIKAPFDKLVHANSRFWNAGAVQVSMSGPGPRVQFQSLASLFGGAVAFETPDGELAGPAAAEGANFELYNGKSTAENAPDPHSVRYHVTFSAADAGGLDQGAPVRLANQRVGSVQHSRLQFDPSSGQLTAQVTITINPWDIQLAGDASWQDDPRQQMDSLLRTLIGQGLRARVGKTVPMVGSDAVLLDFVPNAQQAELGTENVPEIPTAPVSDINGLIASLSGFSAKLNAMPLDQIAEEIHQTTRKLAALSNSPELRRSLQRLDGTMANVDAVTRTAREQVGPILSRLRSVANEAESTVASAKDLLATSGTAQNAPGTSGFGPALYELSRAARSLRELTDFLDRHPEALLHGRG